MFNKLAQVKAHYLDLQKQLEDGSVYADPALAAKLLKEQKELQPVAEAYTRWEQAKDDLDTAAELQKDPDPDMRAMGDEEWKAARERMDALEQELKVLLLPKDRDDDKSVIVEIRGGVGGEEAALFAADLFRMYSMYAERKRFSIEIMNENATELGGYKEISFAVEGKGAWSRFKFESGTHRVQRVPDTESQGRIQTSAATVAVLPEAEDVEIEINPADLQIDTYRSGGAGGQHVNKTESAIRITHLPTGTVVECQDERSQHKNKDRAMKLLRSRLYQHEREKAEAERAGLRRDQVGTGDRSGRIRTYNFPQGRMTDHRINLTLYKLDQVMNGDLDEMIDALTAADQAEKLKASQENRHTILLQDTEKEIIYERLA